MNGRDVVWSTFFSVFYLLPPFLFLTTKRKHNSTHAAMVGKEPTVQGASYRFRTTRFIMHLGSGPSSEKRQGLSVCLWALQTDVTLFWRDFFFRGVEKKKMSEGHGNMTHLVLFTAMTESDGDNRRSMRTQRKSKKKKKLAKAAFWKQRRHNMEEGCRSIMSCQEGHPQPF